MDVGRVINNRPGYVGKFEYMNMSKAEPNNPRKTNRIATLFSFLLVFDLLEKRYLFAIRKGNHTSLK